MGDEAWFKIDVTPEFLRIETFGQRSAEASEELWRSVSKASAESESKKTLLVSYRHGSLPVNSIESIAENCRELVTGTQRFALVFTGKDSERESIGKAIVKAVGTNLRVFGDTDSALQWLSSDE